MPEFEIVDEVNWHKLDKLTDRTVFQTEAWTNFVARTQNATRIVARLHERGLTMGYFTGLVVRKWGLRILGSPFPGWTTAYMGFNLMSGVSHRVALEALPRFVFGKLKCVHFELMDRYLTIQDSDEAGYDRRVFSGFEIDLSQTERRLFGNFTSATRRCIRKAEKSGVVIEEAHDKAFAGDYYAQLEEVFGKQGLIPTYTRERVDMLISEVHPTDRLLLVRACEPGGRCIATGIFPAMNQTMYFWGGASWRQFQILRPNEMIQWYAMKYWKSRGITRYDMGGGGEYKRKYGGSDITVPWIRRSRYPLLSSMRNFAQRLVSHRQRWLGRSKQP